MAAAERIGTETLKRTLRKKNWDSGTRKEMKETVIHLM